MQKLEIENCHVHYDNTNIVIEIPAAGTCSIVGTLWKVLEKLKLISFDFATIKYVTVRVNFLAKIDIIAEVKSLIDAVTNLLSSRVITTLHQL